MPAADSRGVSFSPDFLDRVRTRRAALRASLGELLAAAGPIVWEIGCGHGHFLVRYAGTHPDRLCLGIDLIGDRLDRAGRKRDRSGLARCHFLRAEARECLAAFPPGVSLAEVWVLFPDPWPKARHHKNRLLTADFLDAVAARAQPGARLYFRTDHEEYFRAVEAVVAGLKTWRPDPGAAWPIEPETVFQARAPRHFSLVAVRTAHPAPPIAPVAPGQPPPG